MRAPSGATGELRDKLYVVRTYDLRSHRLRRRACRATAGRSTELIYRSGEKRRIGGLKEPRGVAYWPDHNELVVASAGDGTVRFFDASSLTPDESMTLGDDADNVRVDPKTGQVVVGYGSGALAILDPVRRAVVRTIELGAHPEGFQIDGEGRKAFVNVPNAHKIAAVDLDSGRVLANWRAAHLANFPMALGQDSGIVGMVYRIPARLVALEAASGAPKADLPTCDDPTICFSTTRGAAST